MSAQQLYSLYHLGHQAHHAQQQTIRETSMGNGAPTDQSKLQALLEQPGTGDDDDQRSVCTGIYNPQVTSSKFSDGVRPIDFVLVYNANWRHTKPSLDSDGHVIGPPTMRTPLTESSPLSNDLKSTEDGDVVQKTSLPSPMPVTSGQFLQVVQIEASTSSGGNRNAWSARTMRGSMLLSGFGATMPKDQPSNRERHLAHCCRTFEENLLSEGLQLEYASADFVSTDSQRLAFVKIHAPWEILCRYAEVMKLKMPMKQIEASWRMIFDQDDPYSKGRFTAPYSRDKEYLFDVPADRRLFFTSAQRAQIVEFILKRKSFSTNLNDASAFGINKLLQDGAYLAAYPLHEGVLESPGSGRAAAVIGLSAAGTALGSTSADRLSAPQRRLLDENEHSTRIRLLNNWASLRRVFSRQPLDEIRAYFGVKIALYFAWLGFYTSMLIPASAVGLLCFLYGVFTLDLDVPIKQVCNKTFDEVPMCPLCNIKACDFWYMSDTCTYSKVSYLFDNPATMCFAVFMSLWATVYLEMWKRSVVNLADPI